MKRALKVTKVSEPALLDSMNFAEPLDSISALDADIFIVTEHPCLPGSLEELGYVNVEDRSDASYGRLDQYRADRAHLLDCAWEQNGAEGVFCLVLISTGCRISEALALRWMDVEVSRGTIVIKSLQQRGVARIRRVPAPPALIARLVDLRATSSASFEEKIWSWSRVTAWRRMRDLFSRAKIGGLLATPQALRTSFAKTALDNGVPNDIVRRWLGISYLRYERAHDQDALVNDDAWTDVIWEQSETLRRSNAKLSLRASAAST